MQRRLHWVRRVRLRPLRNRLVEPRQHLIGRQLAEDSHFLRKRIAVERHDSLARQNRSRKWRRSLHWPVGVFHPGPDGLDQRETVLLGASLYRWDRDRRILGS